MTLLVGMADDINVGGNSILTVKDLFLEGRNASWANRDQNKRVQRRRNRVGQNATWEEYNFERVITVKYLGATIAQDNILTGEIKSGNKRLYVLKSVLAAKNIAKD